jgi:hypothetical protein
MAKLPTAADIAGRVQPISMPNVRVPQDAFPDFSEAGNAIGKAGLNFALGAIQTNNATEAQDASNQFSARARELQYGNATGEDYDADGQLSTDRPDFKPGYLNQYGLNAVQGRAEAERNLDDFRKELEKGLSNGAVRSMFRKTADARQAKYLTSIASHFQEQRKTYRKSVIDTTINEATESAILEPDNPDHINDVYRARFTYERELGADIDTAKSLAEEARSKAHIAVINDLTVKDPSQAEAYLQKNKDEIDPDLRRSVIKPLQENRRMQEANNDLRYLGLRYKLNTPEGDQDAIAYLRKRYKNDAQQLKVSETRLKNELTRLEEISNDRRESLRLSATKKLMKDPNAKLTNPEMSAVLESTGGMAQLIKMRTTKPRIAEEKSAEAYGAFSEAFVNETRLDSPKKVMTVSEYNLKYWDKMNKSDYDRGLRLVQAWHNANTKKEISDKKKAEAQTVINTAKRIESKLVDNGFVKRRSRGSKSGFNTRSKKVIGAFTARIDELVRAAAQKQQKELTPDEIDKIIDQELLKIVRIEGSFMGTDRNLPAAAVNEAVRDGNRVYIPIKRINQESIEALSKILEANQLLPSDPDDVRQRIEDFAAAVARGRKSAYIKRLQGQGQ